MTIASTTNRNDYVGNGATSVYSYSFKIFSDSDLLVTQRDTDDVETTLVLNTDYTVTDAGETSGGTIVLTAGNLTTDYKLSIRRVRPLTQETDIRNQGDFFAETHEDVFDGLIMVDQQQQNEIDRSLQLAETETGVSAALPIAEAFKWFRWNAAGTALESVDAGDLSIVTTVGPDLTLAASNLSITIPNRFGVAGGTVDAITTVTSPVVASLTNNLAVIVEAAGANATTTPTFSPDGMTAKTIVKSNDISLALGDIPGANYRMHLVFDLSLDKWVLLNPYYPVTRKGADVASAAALPLLNDGDYNDVTGNDAITSMDSVYVGARKTLHFNEALTLTHHAADLILPNGANIAITADDKGTFVEYVSGKWKMIGYVGASILSTAHTHKSVAQGGILLNLGTEQASTSGTAIDFTSIPAGTKKITIMFVGVSTDGTEELLVQIGDAGGVETTGYLCGVGDTGVSVNSTVGFILEVSGETAAILHGMIVLTLEDPTAFTWVAGISIGKSNNTTFAAGGGSKSLSAELTTVRITTTGTPDDFDAGAINIQFE